MREEIKRSLDKLGIGEGEEKYLGGVCGEYECEVVYDNMEKEVEEKGIMFKDRDSGLEENEELLKK
nr:hypothetical protein [Staphylococcus aureus]